MTRRKAYECVIKDLKGLAFITLKELQKSHTDRNLAKYVAQLLLASITVEEILEGIEENGDSDDEV